MQGGEGLGCLDSGPPPVRLVSFLLLFSYYLFDTEILATTGLHITIQLVDFFNGMHILGKFKNVIVLGYPLMVCSPLLIKKYCLNPEGGGGKCFLNQSLDPPPLPLQSNIPGAASEKL